MAVLTWKSHNNTIGQQAVIENALRDHLIELKLNFTGRQWKDICDENGVFYNVSKAMLNGFVVLDENLLKMVKTPSQATALYENMKTIERLYEQELKKDPSLGI